MQKFSFAGTLCIIKLFQESWLVITGTGYNKMYCQTWPKPQCLQMFWPVLNLSTNICSTQFVVIKPNAEKFDINGTYLGTCSQLLKLLPEPKKSSILPRERKKESAAEFTMMDNCFRMTGVSFTRMVDDVSNWMGFFLRQRVMWLWIMVHYTYSWLSEDRVGTDKISVSAFTHKRFTACLHCTVNSKIKI